MITFITSLYRSEKHLESYLMHVKEFSQILQTKRVSFEFLIISNDSSETEKNILNKIKDKDFVRVIEVPREPLYATWNRGVKEARGEIIGFWNVDDIRWADAVVEAEKIFLAGAEVVYFPFIYKRYVNIFGLNLLAKKNIITPPEFNSEKFKNEMHVGPFFMFTKKAFEDIGGFDESFKIAGDFEWAIRAASKKQFKLIKQVAGIFTNDGNTLSGSHDNTQQKENWRITKKDAAAKILGLEFMDQIHDYEDPFGNVRYYHRLKAYRCLDFLEKSANPEKVFLDAGAGRGPYSFIAQDKYKKVYCFEFDHEELEAAKRYIEKNKIGDVVFDKIDLTTIPLANNSVDVIVCSEVLEHIKDNEKAIRELHRVLQPGGKLLLSMPNRFSLFYERVYRKNKNTWFKKENMDKYFEERRHVEYPFWKIEKLAQIPGFKIVKRSGANIIPLPEKVRRLLTLKYPEIFKAYIKLEHGLSAIFPRLSSFYFLYLIKEK